MKKTNNITESQNKNSVDIDTKSVAEIVQIFHNDNKSILLFLFGFGTESEVGNPK